MLQGVLQGDGVDDRSQHAHVVGAHAVHLFGLLGHAAEKVASAHHDADFNAQCMHVDKFAGNLSDLAGIQAEAARAGQHLAR